jgi:alkanesulfonate monooxygenase SsuD/methylene tetrahydromethanopterin reductase-like flavin-dependent oxidoreductase (luciferase family)
VQQVTLSQLPVPQRLSCRAAAPGRVSGASFGVTIVPFGYQPFVFARQLAQVDRLSRGRLRVMLVPGLGSPQERKALGTEGRDRRAGLAGRRPARPPGLAAIGIN